MRLPPLPPTLLMAATFAFLFAMPGAAAAPPPAPAPAPANPREQWLVQARAADAIGEVLMAAIARAEVRVDALRNELADADKRSATADAARSPATRDAQQQQQAAYRTLVDHVAAEVRRGGGAVSEIDPSFESLSGGQLFAEMTALQSYNLRTFRRLAELREQEAELCRRRLDARANGGGVATQPAIATTEQLARDAVAALNRPQRGEAWAAARQKMRNAIATARAPQPPPAAAAPGAPNATFAPPANAAVLDDPRWQRYYYGPADPFSGGTWGAAMYDEPFEFRGGGGVYERFDTRVNADFDTRTRSQPDRRVNVQFDRRLNMHVDPRENF